MTQIQQAVVKAIITLTKNLGFPPTVDEIAQFIGRAKSTTHVHLDNLRKNGVIDWKESCPRTIHIVREKRHEFQ